MQLSIMAGIVAFGAVGITLGLVGAGVPFLVAALVAAVLAGLVHHMAQRVFLKVPPTANFPAENDAPSLETKLRQQLEDYRLHTATLRHDLRGVLSPALMMSDRLLNHADPAVQRAGNAVVRSIDRATALLAGSKDLMATGDVGQISVKAAPGARDNLE